MCKITLLKLKERTKLDIIVSQNKGATKDYKRMKCHFVGLFWFWLTLQREEEESQKLKGLIWEEMCRTGPKKIPVDDLKQYFHSRAQMTYGTKSHGFL